VRTTDEANDDTASRPAPDIRVLIADDEALVRAGFRVLVDSAIRMPVMGGLEATKVILDGDQDPPPRILIVTTFDEDEHVFEALRGDASGFVLKDTPPEKLLDAIAIIAAGEALLAPAITRRLIAEFARQPRGHSWPAVTAQGRPVIFGSSST
jgi:DNA-binding NarL/FixJ family response regulator